MTEEFRTLDDPSNTKGTLLALPLSDFPNSNAASAGTAAVGNGQSQDEDDDDADLILISLPSSSNNGGLTMDDLIRGESVYILGETSENDIPNNTNAVIPAAAEEENGASIGGSIEPVAARLIVEGKASSDSNNTSVGKTMQLTRVETSNTYIVVPPMPVKTRTTANGDNRENDESNKRQKLDSSSGSQSDKKLVTMPARSIGLVPGEESPSCFFLDPSHLQPGHFASKLRGSISRWMYDPFDPPVAVSESDNNDQGEGGSSIFGYTVSELAHICRTSRTETEFAVQNRVFGAEDALAIPASSNSTTKSVRYGMLSEEGRQTVSMAIVTALLESDLDLVWKSEKDPTKGVQLKLLMEEIRTHWHSLEGETSSNRASSSQVANPYLTDSRTKQPEESQSESQSQFGTPSQFPASQATNNVPLAEEVIWHCLRPILHYEGNSTSMSKDEMSTEPAVVQLVPDQVAKLAAHAVFLGSSPRSTQSTGAGSAVWWEEEEFIEAWSMRLPSMSSGYEPKTELLSGVAISEMKEADGDDPETTPVRRWQYFPEAGLPLVPLLRIKSMFAMRDAWTLEEAVPYLEKFMIVSGEGKGLNSMVADVLKKYAKAVKLTEKDEDGKEVSVMKYVAVPK